MVTWARACPTAAGQLRAPASLPPWPPAAQAGEAAAGPWRVASERQAGTGVPASWARLLEGQEGRRAVPTGIPEVTGSWGGQGGQQGCLWRLSGSW